MRKIPTIFERDWNGDPSHVLNKPVAACQWVFDGEGVATRKYDGTAVLIRDGKVFVRYDAKNGKTPPPGFEPCEPEPDANDGHWPGWVPYDGKDKRLNEGLTRFFAPAGPEATYELIGPKVNGNPEHLEHHILLAHVGAENYPVCPRTFDGLKTWLADKDIEGIVWHHPDGRMAKVKKRDFGLKRNAQPTL